jgi:HPr kinase/phosphorylase
MALEVSTLLQEKGKDFILEIIAGEAGLKRNIEVCDINRPGLAFSGYFNHFPHERPQVIGNSEYTYLATLDHKKQADILNRVFSYEDTPCCILTRNLEPIEVMIDIANKYSIPLIKTRLPSSSFISDLIFYLNGRLAPEIKMHGVLINVYGLGVFIVGKSGIGKSECALELVKRGHMLIADDVVNIRKMSGRILKGTGMSITKDLIEVRGLGIINVMELFGIGSILDKTEIELVIKLEEWHDLDKHERLGSNEYFYNILDIEIPQVSIPVAPGRNLAALVETASLNQRLKDKGFCTAKDLEERLQKAIEKNEH